MIDMATVDALSTIALLMAIVLMYPGKRLIHVFLDNARYHHARLVQEWLARPGWPDQASFHFQLLPASRSDRALVGADAQQRHPQPMLRGGFEPPRAGNSGPIIGTVFVAATIACSAARQ
jgi:hypothetical protein